MSFAGDDASARNQPGKAADPGNPADARTAATAISGRTRESESLADGQPDDIVAFIPALRAFGWSLCRREQEVDDLVQETLVKGIANFDHYSPGTNLRAWLFTIMRNTWYTNAHKTARERPGAADCVSGSPSVAGTQLWSVRGNELWDAIGRLPPHYREVLILVVMLGESYEDAVRILGFPMGTVKSRVNRARKMVMDELGETKL